LPATRQRDVLDGDALAVQDPQRVHQAAAAVVHRHVGAMLGDVSPRIVTDPAQHAGDRREVPGVADVHFDHVVAGAGLQLRGRAGGDHPAVVDDDDMGRRAGRLP
jgi:hypothetical protein